MAAPCFIAFNGVAATSTPWASFAGVTTGTSTTAPKTMLQIKPGASKIRIIEWGYSFTAAPTAAVQVDLIDTGTVAATVVAGIASPYNDVTGPASLATLSTTGTGFTSSGEGTITSVRLLAYQTELGTQFKQQFPLGREPEVNGGNIIRIRAMPTTATASNMVCYMIWEE